VIGVYVGFDNPKPLGKNETGAKTALPIFKHFLESSVKKFEARPFKVPNDIVMMVVDSNTGQKVKFSSKNTIIENYKKKDIVSNKVKMINNKSFDENKILKFY
jgi:penicillin-binding protein 1A